MILRQPKAVVRIVSIQSATVLVLAAVMQSGSLEHRWIAVLYGGGVALTNLLLLWWRWWQGAEDYHCDGGRHVRTFYRSMLERFFVVGILLAVGLGLLKLAPLAMLAGFVVGQLSAVIGGVALRERTKKNVCGNAHID